MQTFAKCSLVVLQDWNEDVKPTEHRTQAMHTAPAGNDAGIQPNQDDNGGMGIVTALEDDAIRRGDFQPVNKAGYGTTIFRNPNNAPGNSIGPVSATGLQSQSMNL